MSAPTAIEPLLPTDPLNSEKPAPFEFITENTCLTERQTNRERKKAKKMVCECLLDEDYPSSACGADCLNRLLMIEWYVLPSCAYCMLCSKKTRNVLN